MDDCGSVGINIMLFGVALFFFPLLVPRQYWLKVKLGSIPKSIKGDGEWYWGHNPIFHFPSWMLNWKYKFIMASSLSFILVGILIPVVFSK